jgi:Ca2+-binding EF-hand superfamily protein
MEREKKFDKDGDGKLSDEERKAMMEANKARMEEFRKTREKPFDKDGDGKLNDEERKAMMEAMQKRRPNAGPQFQEMLKKFDKDGDGKLNEEERKAMREARLNAPAQPKPAAPAAAAK